MAHTLHIECSRAWLSVCSLNTFGMLTLSLLKPQQGVFILALGNVLTVGTWCSLVRGFCLRRSRTDQHEWGGEGQEAKLRYFPLRLSGV